MDWSKDWSMDWRMHEIRDPLDPLSPRPKPLLAENPGKLRAAMRESLLQVTEVMLYAPVLSVLCTSTLSTS